MKKAVAVLAFILLLLVMQTSLNADEVQTYKDEIYSKVDRLEIDISPSELEDISTNRVLDYLTDVVSSAVKSPIRLLCTVIMFSVIQRLADILGNNKAVYTEIITVICFLASCPMILSSVEGIITSCEAVQGFLIGYIPIFAGIIASSGNLSGATSYNAVLLYACESAAIAFTSIVKPLIMCMLAITAIKTINPQMPNITQSIRRLVVTLIGFIMSIFLGIIGLQGIVGRTKDSLTLKAGKYIISSFVPIIGGTLNESYRTVKAGLDSIRNVIGTFGIVVVIAVLIIPIVQGFIHRWIMILGEFLTGSFGSSGIGELCRGFSDIYLLLTTLVTLYMLMLIIATGALIALGGVSG